MAQEADLRLIWLGICANDALKSNPQQSYEPVFVLISVYAGGVAGHVVCFFQKAFSHIQWYSFIHGSYRYSI